MQEKKQYTFYDIAAIANVAPSTVSRVVNGVPGISKSTRTKVQRVLDAYHYVPNETARGLATQSSKLIGILISDIRLTHHADGVFYVEQELAKRGYCCLILNTGVEEDSQAKHIQMLSQRKVDAAVLMGSIYQTETVRRAIETYLPQTPVMICNGYLNLPNVYGVIADERFGVERCVQLLAQRGKKHPAFVLDRETPSNLEKRQGYEDAVRRELPEAKLVTAKTDNTRLGAYSAMRKLLEEYPETDGIVYSDDVLATVGVHALRDLKRKIPEEVAVIGINNSFYAELSTPQLTSLDNMLYDQSLTVVRTLLDLLTGNHVNRQVMICSEIVERETT